ncbi:helix-turn-helix transcriptional regulator [Flavobacterium columnare]|uniref:helix-turn-helix transcriptional regulator n=1 Tax=Flavobacterium columnare TaxID=996 RepID=UPI000F4FC9CF|nr:helix-turn-helix transcriptional regulator [Flavobacterium columnare]
MNGNFIRTGERLRLIRRDLKLKIVRIERELSFPTNTISRIEKGEGGTINSFIKLVLYYYQRGYNINYIIGNSLNIKASIKIKNNENIDTLEFKKNLEEIISKLINIKDEI